jgi:hypothetical protein
MIKNTPNQNYSMTRRDHFAMFAMQVILSQGPTQTFEIPEKMQLAVKYADALEVELDAAFNIPPAKVAKVANKKSKKRKSKKTKAK